ncbi:MAG TPA: hypothetical protein VNI36_13380 [Candidatus Dormibacteraeota bacterium]|nr:hypothetical protein [Candidatus Dormibacteraeota bacterium]
MICPNCKCEYIRGVTHCAECDVALVDEVEAASAAPQAPLADDEIVSIWSGNDPRECAAVKQALDEAGIPFTDESASGYFMFPSLRPKIEIHVSTSDRERAQKIVLEKKGLADPDDLTPEEIESLALPPADEENSGEYARAPGRFPKIGSGDWPEDEDDDAGIEVWNGEHEDLADTLAVCLREIGIASRKREVESRWSLVVQPGQETRAREIVREVVDASPPE